MSSLLGVILISLIIAEVSLIYNIWQNLPSTAAERAALRMSVEERWRYCCLCVLDEVSR